MFAHMFLVLVNVARCHCFAQYQMFPGFEPRPTKSGVTTAFEFEDIDLTTVTTRTTTTAPAPTTKTTTITSIPSFDCPENETPLNIGAYEVPSQRDLVLLVRNTLIGKFKSYNRKAMYLLRDINQASKATNVLAKKCFGGKKDYISCVNRVKHQCSSITKKMMSTVEEHRRNITFFTRRNVCNMGAMATDPIVLLKILAAEDITLKFALPAFLRLFGDCRVHCQNNYTTSTAKKPRRRLSDQEFLVKHIMTNNVRNFKIDFKKRSK